MQTTVLVSRQDAAKSLGICLRTIDNLINSGEISVRRLGRRVLVLPESLERFARGEAKQ